VGRPELHETLTALVGAIPLDGPVVLDLDLEVPMELTLGLADGALVVHAAPGHSRFTSGFLPPVHTTWLHVVALETDGSGLSSDAQMASGARGSP
jgi:hypothetical protein